MNITIICYNDVQTHFITDINQIPTIVNEQYGIELIDLEITYMGCTYYSWTLTELENILNPDDVIYVESGKNLDKNNSENYDIEHIYHLLPDDNNINIEENTHTEYEELSNEELYNRELYNRELYNTSYEGLDTTGYEELPIIEEVDPYTNKTKKQLRNIADNIISVLQYGSYYANNTGYNISKKLHNAITRTITYLPEELPHKLNITFHPNIIYSVVHNDTISTAISEFINNPKKHICALNFASGMNPGGGFLRGASAQEESIMRSSGLYPCIKSSILYDTNNKDNRNHLYSEHIIFSPKVPVIRNDITDEWVSPCYVSFITTPAVNTKRALEAGLTEDIINVTMAQRIDNILSVAAKNKVDILILGSYGSGVFGGDINTIANNFILSLLTKYKKSFDKVIFAVTSSDHLKIFQDTIDVYMY